MKIYFVGSHSVGKTTLARYVSQHYNIPMITEVARMVLSEKEMNLDALRYDLDQVDDYQRQIFHRQIEEEQKQPASFVSDRSFLDCLSYAAQHARILPELMSDSKIKAHLPVLRSEESYIFFVRPSKATLKADGVRENLSWDGVVSIDAMIKLLLQMWSIRYYTINIDSMQERVNFINAILPVSQ